MWKKKLPQSPSNASPRRLRLDNVSKRFGATVALRPLTLDVHPGELISLLGPSGCGKTTTLRLIAGFEYPDSGMVSIDERDVSRLPPDRRGLGMVFQNYSLFPHMTVGENIGFGLKMAGMARADIAAQVRRMLDMIRLPGHEDRRIDQLSGGQQQRVALARAIVTHPSVLLLDEPLGALDKNLREGMQFEIRRLQQSLGITSVMVTHDQEEAMTMSDRIVVMNHGRILQVGTPREIYERPRTRFVAEFLGTANIVSCHVLGAEAGALRLAFGAGSGPHFTVATQTPSVPGNPVQIALRPEKLVLGDANPRHMVLQSVVAEHVYRGAQLAYLVDVPALGLRLHACRQAGPGTQAPLVPGQSVTLSFDPGDVVVLQRDDDDPHDAPAQSATSSPVHGALALSEAA